MAEFRQRVEDLEKLINKNKDEIKIIDKSNKFMIFIYLIIPVIWSLILFYFKPSFTKSYIDGINKFDSGKAFIYVLFLTLICWSLLYFYLRKKDTNNILFF